MYKVKKLSSFQIIMLQFLGVILVGALLLMLPISSKDREFTSFIDSLFTATSAVCVTGLVIFDTATHWSIFGQAIILLMIQIGGMGIVMVATSFALLSGRKIGLFNRGTIQEALSAPYVGGIVRLTGFILKTIFIIELIGALIMLPIFCKDFGWEGIWMSFFHSISAFCNAGFDLMGVNNEFSSLTSYVGNPIINITIMLLIIIGGIGFLTWDDIVHHKFKISKYRTQSKIILLVTAILILLPAVYFFIFEFKSLPTSQRIFASLFQSVTTRTAGFNTLDLTTISEVGLAIMMILMLIGAAPGSTGGGMKITTVSVLFSSAIATLSKKEDATIFKRRIEKEAISNALAIFTIFISLVLVSAMIISKVENLPIIECLFECISAIGTVGLSLGITSSLSIVYKIVLMGLMFMGRVGGLTLIYAVLGSSKKQYSKLPIDKINVG